MLLVQDICLSWSKKERKAVYAKKREEFPVIYLLDKLPNTFHGDVMIHHLNFWQRGFMFHILPVRDAYHYQFYTSIQDLNLTNLSIRSDSEGYEVIFFYDEHRSGQPIRQGHNKDYHNIDSMLYCQDILNETAFWLKRGQYGRIIWNERKIDYDTGEWFYQLHTINLLYYPEKMPKADIFLTSRLNFEYKQMAVLY